MAVAVMIVVVAVHRAVLFFLSAIRAVERHQKLAPGIEPVIAAASGEDEGVGADAPPGNVASMMPSLE